MNDRQTYTATVIGRGRHPAHWNKNHTFLLPAYVTILLQDIRQGNTPVMKKATLRDGKWFKKAKLNIGDRIRFDARLTYFNDLIYPSQVKKLQPPTAAIQSC